MARDHELTWYEKVQSIVDKVRALPEEARSEALDRECGGDSALRARVERELLTPTDELRSFSDALRGETELSFDLQLDEPLTGQVFRQYRIQELLGEGGMGKVYAAWDERLRRRVAIKFLPARFTEDHTRVEKFRREAQMASALNHPGIVTIHDIDEIDGKHFLVMELVEGKTLRQHLLEQPENTGRLSPLEVIGIAQQLVKVLKATSRAGILHRDLKPENLMLTAEGQLKVLDFGLARLVGEREESPSQTGGEGGAAGASDLFGTPQYMSPEQILKQPLDWRTDVFSAGAILYEMLSGRRPFVGSNLEMLKDAILHQEPTPLSQLVRRSPASLGRTIHRCLAKSPHQRFGSLDELLDELNRTRQQMGLTRVVAPAVGLLLLLMVLVGLSQLHRYLNRFPFQKHAISVSAEGTREQLATITHDGRHLVYFSNTQNTFSAWIMDRRTKISRLLIPASPDGYLWPTISPDDRYLYVVRVRDITPPHVNELIRVTLQGGEPEVLTSGVDSPVTFSPDGEEIAYLQEQKKLGESALIIARGDGTSPRRLRSRKFPDFYPMDGPAWSPDGKMIATTAGSSRGGVHFGIVGIDVASGEEVALSPHRWEHVLGTAWLPDNSGLILLGKLPSSSLVHQVFFLSAKTGKEEQITDDRWDYIGRPSVTHHGDEILIVRSSSAHSLYFTQPSAPGTYQSYTEKSGEDGGQGISWTPQGEVVYSRRDETGQNIWISDLRGNSRQLTRHQGSNRYPVVSPDGRDIVFSSSRTGQIHLYRMGLDGTGLRQLTQGTGDQDAEFSPDGRWIVYSSLKSGVRTLWRIPAGGGTAVQLTETASESPVISPDGKWIACIYHDDEQNATRKIAIIPFDGGAPLQKLALPIPFYRKYRFFRWSLDGKALEYIQAREQVSNIWRQPLNGDPPTEVTKFKEDLILDFEWSRDGRQLLFVRNNLKREVVNLARLDR